MNLTPSRVREVLFDIQLNALAERIVVRVHLGWNAGVGTRLNRLRTIGAALKHITEAN